MKARKLLLRGSDPAVEVTRDDNAKMETVRRMNLSKSRQKCGGGYRILRKKHCL